MERNRRIFKGKQKEKDLIVTFALRDIKLKLSQSSFKAVITSDLDRIKTGLGVTIYELSIHSIEVKWEPPPWEWVKANTDGSLSEDRAGYGFLLRDHSGNLIIAEAAKTARNSINQLELMAIGQSIKMALELGFPKLWVESDSKVALLWITSCNIVPWKVRRLINSIKEDCIKFSSIKFSHIHREGNSLADLLASSQRQMGVTWYRTSQVRPTLKDLLHRDRSDIPLCLKSLSSIYHIGQNICSFVIIKWIEKG
ncbi:hypothetical protein QJS04_geneDACA016665 [Acorus gramineus]|uniref:RNase H type-1 domain-containing protein n=1 Tax=Acorus gramineus TaxID=55184 RepID=A0AAV9ARG0_ACOGR|nr:hypothetical protein QJS04_geneDACA016665 [Acorus gramineus]